MKALTIWQPWASLIAAGAKRCETRSWEPPGDPGMIGHYLAIHAAARKPRPEEWNRQLRAVLEELYGSMIVEHLPLGRVLAVCVLDGVVRTEYVRDLPGYYGIDDAEFALGDFSPGRFAWHLTVAKVFNPPIHAQGRQRLWEWE